MKIVIVIFAIIAVWWLLAMFLSAAMSDGTETNTGRVVRSKRQLRIEKHSWDRDEYWVGAGLILVAVIKLFWH